MRLLHTLLGAGAAALATLLLALPAPAFADSPCQVVNASTGTSYASLQDAQDAAPPGDTLYVRGTCSGAAEIDRSLIITGQQPKGSTPPALDGGGPATAATLQIDAGATVTGRKLTLDDVEQVQSYGTLTLAADRLDQAFITSSAISGGGRLTVHDTLATGSALENLGGVAILNGSTRFTGTSGHDEVIYNSGTLTLNDRSTITGNDTLDTIYNRGTVNMNDHSSISGNTASRVCESGSCAGGEGGGILNVDSASIVNMHDESSISGNSADLDGGGIANYGTVTMKGASTISGNTTPGDGGGIYDSAGSVAMTNTSTVTGNSAGGHGGGVFEIYGGTLTLRKGASVSGNTPDDVYQA